MMDDEIEHRDGHRADRLDLRDKDASCHDEDPALPRLGHAPMASDLHSGDDQKALPSLPSREEGQKRLSFGRGKVVVERSSRAYRVPDEHLEVVLKAVERGVSDTRISRALGINYRTWMRVREEDDRIAGAIAESRKLEENELVSILFEKAREGGIVPAMFLLKSRHGYRDMGADPNAGRGEASRVNIQINLPAAAPTVDAYKATIDAEARRVG